MFPFDTSCSTSGRLILVLTGVFCRLYTLRVVFGVAVYFVWSSRFLTGKAFVASSTYTAWVSVVSSHCHLVYAMMWARFLLRLLAVTPHIFYVVRFVCTVAALVSTLDSSRLCNASVVIHLLVFDEAILAVGTVSSSMSVRCKNGA